MVSGGELGRFRLSDLNYLCVAGAEPAVGLCIYLGGRFRPAAVGGVVVVQGARYGATAWGFNSDGSGLGDAAIGPSLTTYLIFQLGSAGDL